MARSLQTASTSSRLAGRVIASLIDVVRQTSRTVYEPEDALARLEAGHPLIAAVWHGQFMMTVGFRPPGTKISAMVARHGDAEFIGAAMSCFDVDLIRGAGAGRRRKDRGGAHALRAAVRALNNGASIVITADVPPGPARRAGPGIVTLARLSGRPIVPTAVATSRFIALNTWSRMTINLPFSKLAYVAGDPIHVAPDADEEALEAARTELERSLNDVTARAYELAGADIARIAPGTAATGPDAPPTGPGLLLKTYLTAMSLLRPFAPVVLKVRERQGKEDPRRRRERFGVASAARPEGLLVWVHAASVGETNAVLPLLEGLKAARPDLNFLLTTGTVTSAELAEQRLGPDSLHQYVPLDAPDYAARFLDHWRPDLAVFTESEIWPSLILETAARDIPLALINGRISHRSLRRWRRNANTARALFTRFQIVLAQNDRLAQNFKLLGARNVHAVGNLKIDSPPPPIDVGGLERLKSALAPRPIFVAASTHEGEEEIIAQAHRQLARKFDGFCTIIAPRHPERGTSVAERLKDLGLSVTQRSLGAMPTERTDIYIADTIGELGTLYALSPIAFIGGSLIEHGGQNPIEAIRHGAAIITGPNWRNFFDAYRALLHHHGAIEVKTAEELAESISQLLKNQSEMQHMRAGATQALGILSGALERTIELLAPILPDERLKRAS
ncbi:MAG: glycosyltransferase N-terminal domain-containing protein [Hyphomicrobium sp.]